MSERPSLFVSPESAPDPALTRRVSAALERGELCALPTETVYGIAARADLPVALERLRVAKGRSPELSFTWHVAQRAVIERFEFLRPLARRLSERYWPGPLTLVLRGAPAGLEGVARDGWTGVRFPAHEVCTRILEACDFPVVMTSANLHGERPMRDAATVAKRFAESLALVVDGGPSRLGEASGVLALGPGRFELLREGLLRIEDLRRTAGLHIAFVCTGNTCRSPMAEALAGKLLGERLGAGGPGAPRLADFGFQLASMGVFAASGAPASSGAQEVMASRGLDLRGHRSRPTLLDGLQRFDRIYGLTEAHVEALRAQLPPGRHPPLERLDPRADIADPVGGPRAAYERSAAQIERALRLRLDEWA